MFFLGLPSLCFIDFSVLCSHFHSILRIFKFLDFSFRLSFSSFRISVDLDLTSIFNEVEGFFKNVFTTYLEL